MKDICQALILPVIVIAGLSLYFILWGLTPVPAMLAWALVCYKVRDKKRALLFLLPAGGVMLGLLVIWTYIRVGVEPFQSISLTLYIITGILTIYFFRQLPVIKETRLYKCGIKNKAHITGPLISICAIAIILSLWEICLRTDASLKTWNEKQGEPDYDSPWSITDDNRGWLLVYPPGYQECRKEKEFIYNIRANKLGLNDKDYPFKTDSALRIVNLGASFTEGIGASDDSSYSKILQSILPHSEVMNCGMHGSDLLFEYKLLEQKLLAYQPDIVIIAMNFSDMTHVMSRGGFERFRADGTVKYVGVPWWEFLFASSYIVRSIAIRTFHLDFYLKSVAQTATDRQKATEILQNTMDSAQVLCKNRGIRCIFAFHPMEEDFVKGQMVCEPFLRYAQSKDYETIDLLKYYTAYGINAGNAHLYYWPKDTHHNNKGYEVFARGLKDYLTGVSPAAIAAN